MSTWTERVNFLWQEHEPGSDRREKRERSVSMQYVPELTIIKTIFRLSVTSFKSHLISFSSSLQLKYVYPFIVWPLTLLPCDVAVSHFATEERRSLELAVTFRY